MILPKVRLRKIRGIAAIEFMAALFSVFSEIRMRAMPVSQA